MVADHVLFVDDDAHIGHLIRQLLEQHGYRVTVASNGKACLDMARLHPPSLIVLDIMMPGMDGFEVCQQLRQDAGLREVPVLMLTAMEDPKLNERAFAAGAQVCMTKPFRSDHLLNTMHLTLRNAARKRYRVEQQKGKG